MLVVSPHLDDAVFACGALLASCPECTVVTVFAGLPADRRQITDWDARCGFANAGEAIAARRREDETALAALGAQPVWLGFRDSQYGDTPTPQGVGAELRRILRRRTEAPLLLPLGLFHSDHLLAHEASLFAAAGLAEMPLLAYEDAPYRGMKGMLHRRLCELAQRRITATPTDPLSLLQPTRSPADSREALVRKRVAVAAYASQLRGFGEGGYDDLWRPERFWTLELPDATPDG
jgi:LmbE family N-acetylglucosaminyl deacetylase